MPLPLTVSCFSKIQIGFIFLVSAQPGHEKIFVHYTAGQKKGTDIPLCASF